MAKVTPYFSILDKTLEKALRAVRDASPGAKAIVEYEKYVLISGSVADQSIVLRIANADGGLVQTIEPGETTDLVVSTDFETALLIADMDFVKFMSGVLTFSPSKRLNSIVVSADGIEKQLRYNIDVVDDFPGDISGRLAPQFSFTVEGLDRRMRLSMTSAHAGSVTAKSSALHFGLIDNDVVMASADLYRGLSIMTISPDDLEVTGTELLYIINGKSARALIRAVTGYKGMMTVRGEPNGGQVAFDFGGTSVLCRLFPPPFFQVQVAKAVEVETNATVNRETLLNALNLINASATKGAERARITFTESGNLVVEAAGNTIATKAKMSGLCAGVLPASLIVASDQVADIVGDLKGDLVQLGVAAVRGWLFVGSPAEPRYIHYSVPITKDLVVPTISDGAEYIAA